MVKAKGYLTRFLLKNIMSQEFINGILIGAGTTTFGFVLTMVWDVWKTRREKKSLQDNLLNLLSDELEYNISVTTAGKLSLEQELSCLEQKQSLVGAINTPRVDFWEVFKQNYDRNFFSNEQTKIINDIYSKIHLIIANINSRENYRISNGAMSNFEDRMIIYDKALIFLSNEFEGLCHKFKLHKK